MPSAVQREFAFRTGGGRLSAAGKTIARYRKYAYWARRQDALDLKEALAAQGRTVIEPRKSVCLPLSKRADVGIVPPETWEKATLCKRPLTWYWISPLAGKHLIVSSDDLAPFGFRRPILLREIHFKPPRMPGDREKQQLISRKSYLDAKPEKWDRLEENDFAAEERWMRAMGIRGKTFSEIFLTHCANHANFIEPEYFVRDGGEIVPYSIGKTLEICSACLEFFNVIGSRFARKLVVPCPGAVIYAGLAVNRYIEVIVPAAKR